MKRRTLTEDYIPQLLDKSEVKFRETNYTLDFDYDNKSYQP